MSSFDEINYSLRVNKNVERKLLVEILTSLRPEFPISSYRYLGFGSMWYVDFILMHRRLGISDLISVEKDTARKDRAEFNKPFSCVKLLPGSLSDNLPKIDFEKPVIAWLDYDDGIRGPILNDLEEVAQKAAANSVVAVTCNAERHQLEPLPDGVEPQKDTQQAKWEASLRHFAQDLVPDPLPANLFSVQGFMSFLGTALLSHIVHACRKGGRSELVYPLFNFAYSDGAPMVTVGALIADRSFEEALKAKKKSAKHNFFFSGDQFRIEVPHLTRKEKIAFDQLLPVNAKNKIDAKKLNFTIPERLIRAYEQLYNYYPMFEELL